MKRGIRGSLGTWAWILGLLAIPVAGFLLYVHGQLGQVETRNLRNLAKAADAIERLVANAQTSVDNLLNKPDFACQFVERQTRLELVSPARCTRIETLVAARKLRVLLEESGEALLVALVPAAGTHETDVHESPIRFRVRFDRLLGEIPFGRDLDVLLVANQAGRVVGQLAGTPETPAGQVSVRIARLAELAKPGGEALKLGNILDATSVESVVIAGTGYRLLCQPLVISGLRGAGTAGATKEAAASAPGDQAGRWTLCGLVEKDRSLRDALAVAPHLVVGLISLVVLAMFAWPILKLLSMSRRERFRYADVYFLLVGSWGAIMLATLMLVAWDTHVELRGHMRDALESLAAEVDGHLSSEIRAMQAQLRRYDRDLADRPPAGHAMTGLLCDEDDGSGTGYPPAEACGKHRFGDYANIKRRDSGAPAWTEPELYPYLGSAFWILPCSGQQFLKLTVRRENTPPVSVAGRDYFQAVATNRLWPLPPSGEPPGPQSENARGSSPGIYIQTFRSITTGEFAAALSLRSILTLKMLYGAHTKDEKEQLLASYPDCDGDFRVAAALSGKPASTTHPALAASLGLAIMSADGTVMFHSDERRALFENLYEEIEDSDELAAAVAARSALHLQTSYAARPSQVFLTPMRGLPWFIVTFADSELLRTNNIETLMTGGLYLIVHLGIYFALTVLYVAIRGRATPAWLWPYLSARPSPYRWMSWMLALVLLAAVLGLRTLQGPALVWICLLVPLLPIAALTVSPHVLRLKHGDRWAGRLCAGGATLATLGLAAIYAAAPDPGSLRPFDHLLALTGLGVWLGGMAILLFPGPAAALGSWLGMRGTGPSRRARRADPGLESGALRGLEASRRWHMISAFVIWVLIAMVPAWGYARFAVAEQLRVLMRHENVYLLRGLEARNHAVREYYRGVDVGDALLKARLALTQRDVYWTSIFWRGEGLGPRYEQAGQVGLADPCPATDPPASERDPSCTGFANCLLASPGAPQEWLGYLPIYNETSRQMRFLARPRVGVGRWLPATMAGNGNEARGAARGRYLYCPSAVGPSLPGLLHSRMPIHAAPLGGATGMGAILILLLLVPWVRYGTLQLFFGNITPDPREPYFRGLLAGEKERVQPRGVPGVGRGVHQRAGSRWLEDEELRYWDPDLRARHAAALQALCGRLTRRELLDAAIAHAVTDFRAMWTDCTEDEQLVLLQLAKEGVANPKQAAAVRSLLDKRLLVRDPVLHIMSRSFALFVLQEHRPDLLARLEHEQEGFGWKQARWILLAVVGAIVLFLWTTQPSTVENIIKYLSAAAVGAGALMKLATVADRFTGRAGQD